MHMVRHQEYQTGVPNSLCVSMFDRFENSVRQRRLRELVLSALLIANRNEIVCFARIDPKRDIMRQSFAIGCHYGPR